MHFQNFDLSYKQNKKLKSIFLKMTGTVSKPPLNSARF